MDGIQKLEENFYYPIDQQGKQYVPTVTSVYIPAKGWRIPMSATLVPFGIFNDSWCGEIADSKVYSSKSSNLC